MLLLATFDLSGADVALFDEYEAQVLPLLERHGGRLLKRVRSLDSAFEIHLLEFDAEAGVESYGRDPDRQAAHGLFQRSGAQSMVTPVAEV